MEVDNVESENVVSSTDDVTKCEDIKSENHVDHVTTVSEFSDSPESAFKKPDLIIGSRRGKPGITRTLINVKSNVSDKSEKSDESPAVTTDVINESDIIPQNAESEKNNTILEQKQQFPLPYKEPSWSSIPNCEYKIEVLKSGVILDAINLNEKSFYVIGRLPGCDIPLAHPTISRYHAILQYRNVGDDKNGPGYYIYDLESTHGTFWNNCRIKPRHYVKLHGGHMIRFGCSQRKFIFQSPPDEVEAESEYSVTELKEIRRLELQKREEGEKERQAEEEEIRKLKKEKEEDEGIDWGMGEDADEESDMTENPYALTANEELFLDDPKKTLRGWFEREGHEMQYQTEEKGIGQFLCWIELPIDNITGRPIRAEALVKGKKKESVVQCALEACRILDRQGLLRQATHEGKKRKTRNWEEEDYYDSDEDNFLDRTGTVERKREKRMRNAGKLETKAETHSSLIEKHSVVVTKITKIQSVLKNHENAKNHMNDNSNEDALDAFMSNLSSALLNKADVTKMKLQLQNLRKEEETLKKLIHIAKPANLPSLNLPKSIIEPEIKSIVNSNLKISTSSNDKHQRLDNKNSNQRLVPNVGQYGLLTKNDEISVEKDKTEEKCDTNEKETDENIVDIENTENNEKTDDSLKESGSSTSMKIKKRNMRRLQQKAEKIEKEIKKGYDETVYREDYSMWIPPKNQSGDGKTSLNDKLGY